MNPVVDSAEILKRTAALAKAEHNLEMMDCVAILHGYLELSAFRPDDLSRKKEVDDAVGRLLNTAAQHPNWSRTLAEFIKPNSASSSAA